MHKMCFDQINLHSFPPSFFPMFFSLNFMYLKQQKKKAPKDPKTRVHFILSVHAWMWHHPYPETSGSCLFPGLGGVLLHQSPISAPIHHPCMHSWSWVCGQVCFQVERWAVLTTLVIVAHHDRMSACHKQLKEGQLILLSVSEGSAHHGREGLVMW